MRIFAHLSVFKRKKSESVKKRRIKHGKAKFCAETCESVTSDFLRLPLASGHAVQMLKVDTVLPLLSANAPTRTLGPVKYIFLCGSTPNKH